MKYYITPKGRELLEARIAVGGKMKGVQRSALDKPGRAALSDADVRRREGEKATHGRGYKMKPVKPDHDFDRRLRQANIQAHDREAAAWKKKK